MALQKEVFLLANFNDEVMEETDYEPHSFGCYSEVVEITMDMLQQLDLAKKGKNDSIYLTEFGEEVLSKSYEKSLVNIEVIQDYKELLNDLTNDEIFLIIYLYKPEYTTESIVEKNVFKNRVKLATSIYNKGKVTLSKAAHLAGMNIEDFLKTMGKIC